MISGRGTRAAQILGAARRLELNHATVSRSGDCAGSGAETQNSSAG